MTVIVKSNVAYSGPSTLTPVSQVTMSAADIYAAYAARVTADGGTVADATACLAAITAALAGDYYWRTAIAISPRWGHKTSAGTISKLYNLIGAIDGICTGTVSLDTTTQAWNTAKFDAVADQINFTGVTVNKAGSMGFVASTLRATDTQGVLLNFTPAAEQWQFRDYEGKVLINSVSKISDPGAVVDNQSIGLLVEQSSNRFSEFSDGVHKQSTTNAFTALANNATATVNLQPISVAQVNLAELWYFNAASFLSVQSCSFDIGARY